jgi:hypothetical protein
MKLSTALKNVIDAIPEGVEKEVIKDFIASKEEKPEAGKAYAYKIVLPYRTILSDEPFNTRYECEKALHRRVDTIARYYPDKEIISTEVYNIYKRLAEMEKATRSK